VTATKHVAMRPSFYCAICHEPWPCKPSKAELRHEFRDDQTGLFIYLGSQLEGALEAAIRNHDWKRVDNLYERFIGWVRASD
jgi:hypothetical protein